MREGNRLSRGSTSFHRYHVDLACVEMQSVSTTRKRRVLGHIGVVSRLEPIPTCDR
ncbi:hypothetical protein Mapa_016664 [Marchantia paleacea]|nr:hypothetical protein Mapa_016664 [Marchantia paleacea]